MGSPPASHERVLPLPANQRPVNTIRVTVGEGGVRAKGPRAVGTNLSGLSLRWTCNRKPPPIGLENSARGRANLCVSRRCVAIPKRSWNGLTSRVTGAPPHGPDKFSNLSHDAVDLRVRPVGRVCQPVSAACPSHKQTWPGTRTRLPGRARLRPSPAGRCSEDHRDLGRNKASREPGPPCPPAAYPSATNRPPGAVCNIQQHIPQGEVTSSLQG
jgi:hypothetical protein